MGKYRYLEDVAIADSAFEAEADTLNDLFQTCAIATFEVMADTSAVESKLKEDIELVSENLDELLFDWLAELIYLKDSKAVLFGKFDVEIKQGDEISLTAAAWGEPVDQLKHKVRVDVKAVTYHLLEVRQSNDRWIAKVVLDT